MTPLRRAMWLGFAVQLAGMGFDGWWHSNHPGDTGAAEMAQAHAGIYLGILLVVGAAVPAFRAAPDGALRIDAGGVLAGGLLQIVGNGWDAWAHASGAESALAHQLGTIGLVVVLAGLVHMQISNRRRRRRLAEGS